MTHEEFLGEPREKIDWEIQFSVMEGEMQEEDLEKLRKQ
jgi:CRISPR/Cas system-associated endoribonuclease Cas2